MRRNRNPNPGPNGGPEKPERRKKRGKKKPSRWRKGGIKGPVTFTLLYPLNRTLLLGFLVLMTLPLLIALPMEGTVEQALEFGFDLKTIFLYTFVLGYGIVGLNLGQGEMLKIRERLERKRKGPVRDRLKVPVPRLLAQIGFILVLTIPYWVLLQGVAHISLGRILGSILSLILFGVNLVMVGAILVVRIRSESVQLLLKYGILGFFLAITLFYIQFLNPFLALSSILDNGIDRFAVLNYSILAGVGGLLVWYSQGQWGKGSNKNN